jgi:alpha-glucosidase
MKTSFSQRYSLPCNLKGAVWLAAVIAGLLLAPGASSARGDEVYRLSSPDGKIEISIRTPRQGSEERPIWSATFHGKPLLTDCELGLQTAEAGDLLTGVRVLRQHSRSADRRIRVLFGRADHAQDSFHETRFTLETHSHRQLDVVFRCYDDAVALRYELPGKPKNGSVTVTDETTSFRVAGAPTAYAQYLESYTTSHEHNVTNVNSRDIPPGTLLDMPLTFSWADGTYLALTEASLRHYAGMSLMRTASDDSPPRLVCKLTPRPDGTKVVRPLPMMTPWRVALIGDRPGALLESGTLYCLNDASVIKDVSWIKPGKITFP